MPEPVSNAEVEDVLASIRRLVSEDKRTAQPRPEPAAPEAGKLVLTPALRVAEPETDDLPESGSLGAEVAEADSGAVSAPKAEAEEAADADMQSELACDDATQTSDEPADAAETDDDITPVDQDVLAAEHARLAAKLVMARTAEQDSDTTTGSAISAASSVEASAPDDDAEADDEAMPGEGAAPPNPLSRALQSTVEVELADALTARAPAEPEPEQSAEMPPKRGADARPDPSSLGAKIAALEAAVGRRQDDWEPDGVAEAEPYSGTAPHALAWEDEAGPGAEAAEVAGGSEGEALSGPSVSEPVEEIEAADLVDESALLDEEALRDLVAEIVREELQGALGERITRNVRKLVRREIQRALAAHDLD